MHPLKSVVRRKMGEGVMVKLIPIGVDEALLREVIAEVELSLPGVKCTVCKACEMNSFDFSDAFNKMRRQYLADTILRKLPTPSANERVVGVVGVDIYSGRLNFVFGIAELPGKRALVSTYRLLAGGVPREVFIGRLIKEIVHELGHTFGLHHCEDSRCVMRFSNSIADTDYKSKRLCANCLHAYRAQFGRSVATSPS